MVDKIDEEKMEIQVVSLKCMDSSKMLFSLNENDKSDVPYEDVMGIISEPRILSKKFKISDKRFINHKFHVIKDIHLPYDGT
ncbi:unnamed protein product [Arctia plantaginis]|uniref:Uncharacterized protein n=1 Tax=Arctia plantaginis TaxID=874455 RepID=A0A8S0YYG5_ARCPL|nr:unnamed protein product [Arctia plantaginis]